MALSRCWCGGIALAGRAGELVPDRFYDLFLLRRIDFAEHIGDVKQVGSGEFNIYVLGARMSRFISCFLYQP